MTKTTMALLLVCMAVLSGCVNSSGQSKWAETTGRIANVTTLDDGTFAYTLIYNVEQSATRNAKGELIKGPIPQHYLGKPEKPLSDQKLKVRYLREEPTMYELLEEIRFVEQELAP